MTRPDPGPTLATPGPGADAGRASQRTAWLLFGPPAFMVAVRWLLQMAQDRANTTPALPLAPVSTTTGLADLLWPVALALAVLAGAALVLRRIGWRRAMPLLGALWLLLWLAGSGALVQRHLNRQGLFLQGVSVPAAPAAPAALAAPVTARVVTTQFKRPSLRSLGGTELVLRVAGLEIPQRLLLDDPRAASLKPGDALALQLAPGRFSGLFVTGWQALPSPSP